MKKLEIIIKPEKLEIIKAILDEQDVNGMNFVNTMGYGKQNGTIKSYNGTEYKIGFVPKIKVEKIIADEMVEPIVTKILEEVNTGQYGDGKIAIYNVEDYIRIRTGERGNDAL